MNLSKLKDNPKLPQHIAFIIDGNGRWAKRRGLPRSYGHQIGADNVEKMIGYIQELGIKNATFYCFSAENWNRPQQEVDFLMTKFDEMLNKYKNKFLSEDVRIIISGDMHDDRIPESVRLKVAEIMEATKNKTGFSLNMCINYGGRQEILRAVNAIIDQKINNVNQQIFEQYLYTATMLPLDFIIRTSGETRTSNFMPWQSTYSEWYFPKVNWPAFNKKHLLKAINNYTKRNRRYGAIKE